MNAVVRMGKVLAGARGDHPHLTATGLTRASVGTPGADLRRSDAADRTLIDHIPLALFRSVGRVTARRGLVGLPGMVTAVTEAHLRTFPDRTARPILVGLGGSFALNPTARSAPSRPQIDLPPPTRQGPLAPMGAGPEGLLDAAGGVIIGPAIPPSPATRSPSSASASPTSPSTATSRSPRRTADGWSWPCSPTSRTSARARIRGRRCGPRWRRWACHAPRRWRGARSCPDIGVATVHDAHRGTAATTERWCASRTRCSYLPWSRDPRAPR
jgi:hypothetical protein